LANIAPGDELVSNGFSRIHGSGRMRETNFGVNDIISEEGNMLQHQQTLLEQISLTKSCFL
jgi:hypothetical protein